MSLIEKKKKEKREREREKANKRGSVREKNMEIGMKVRMEESKKECVYSRYYDCIIRGL